MSVTYGQNDNYTDIYDGKLLSKSQRQLTNQRPKQQQNKNKTKQTNKQTNEKKKKKKEKEEKKKRRPVLPNPLRSAWQVQSEVQSETTKTVVFTTTASACKQGMCCDYDELCYQGRKKLPASPSNPWKTVTTQHTTAGRGGLREDTPKFDTVEKVMKTTCAPRYHRLITLFLCLAVPPCPALSRKRRASL